MTVSNFVLMLHVFVHVNSFITSVEARGGPRKFRQVAGGVGGPDHVLFGYF